jgi:hypothetical protein
MAIMGEGRSCFAVGVFQDTDWAERGIDALTRKFPSESVSLLAKQTPDVVALVEKTLGVQGNVVEVKGLGALTALGPLLDTLQGDDEGLGRTGVAATMRRAGFQTHDGFIFETLTARGGVLVAIEGEPRVADALALLHAYGGGNAAIGAWTGRV